MTENCPLVSVIIPAWNDQITLPGCLESVFSSDYGNLEVIVVDNASTDGTFNLLESKFPRVRAIRNPRNIGFGGAINQARSEARGEYVLLLSSDARLDREWIGTLVQAFDEDGRLGMATSIVVYGHTTGVVWSAGGFVDGMTGLAWDHGKGENISSVSPPDRPDYLSACAAMLRRPALDAVGWLDSGYFVYFEDADLSLRLKEAGYRLAITDKTVVQHSARRKSGIRENAPEKLYLFARSNFRFILKNWPVAQAPLSLLLCFGFYFGFALVKGPSRYVPRVVAALIWNFSQLRSTRSNARPKGNTTLPISRLGGLFSFIIRMIRKSELYPY